MTKNGLNSIKEYCVKRCGKTEDEILSEFSKISKQMEEQEDK